jgi:hypothetical protein
MRIPLLGCVLIALAVVNSHLSAQEAKDGEPYVEQQTGLTFPKTIERLKFDSAKDFGDPKLGIGIRYRSPEGLLIDAIIYNHGLKMIAADPADARVKQEADQALKDIETAAERGFYKDLKVIGREVVPLTKGGAPQTHKLSLSYTLSDKPRESYLHLLVHKNHFVKVRATWFPEAKEAGTKDVASFMTWLAGEMK